MPTRKQLRAQTSGTVRTETLLGRSYTVVPVVAMVEGVRFGALQEDPELGLASEFGKAPVAWNNRPVTNGHPVVDGKPVSANLAPVLEEFAFGLTMNTVVDDTKLKMEAWLDTERLQALAADNADVLSYMTRINAGEVVDVSVGFYSDVEPAPKGAKFNGQAYGGIWRNIVPDHLAFLPEGTPGACSVADGCGVPRINEATSMPNGSTLIIDSSMDKKKKDCGCSGAESGSACTCDHGSEDMHTQESSGQGTDQSEEPTTHQLFAPDKEGDYSLAINAALATVLGETSSGLMDNDVRKALQAAIRKANTGYAYLIGFTADKAVYETWSNPSDAYLVYQISYTIDSSGNVTLSGDPEEVTLMTKIVKVNEAGNTEETSMPNDNTHQTQNAGDQSASNPPGNTELHQQSQQPQQAPARQLTIQEFLQAAPAELQETLSSAMRLHNDKKAALITVLKGTGRCKFTDEHLRAQSLESLEMLAALADVPTYDGRAAPAPRQQSQQESMFAAPPPKLFQTNNA